MLRHPQHLCGSRSPCSAVYSESFRPSGAEPPTPSRRRNHPLTQNIDRTQRKQKSVPVLATMLRPKPKIKGWKRFNLDQEVFLRPPPASSGLAAAFRHHSPRSPDRART